MDLPFGLGRFVYALIGPGAMIWKAVLCCLICGSVSAKDVGPIGVAPRSQTEADHDQGRMALVGDLPDVSARLQPVGRMPAKPTLRLAISLPLADTAGLAELIQQMYDPASPEFRHYLTPEQFTARFGPSREAYQTVKQFAFTNRLVIVATHEDRMLLEVQGTVENVEQAFHVRLWKYQHPTENRQFYGPDTAPSVASSLPILDIAGLSDFVKFRSRLFRQSSHPHPVPALGSAPGGNYMGRDFRNAYFPGVDLDGHGQIIGLIEFDGYLPADIQAYEALTGLPAVPLTNVLVGGFDGIGSSAEVSLDIELAIAMAPGLDSIAVFEAPGTTAGILAILSNISSINQIRQFSCSWGIGTGVAFNGAFSKLAAQGQTFLIASGDSGAYVQPQTVWMENPLVTSVGGTSLTMNGLGVSYGSETVWKTGNDASGGGSSSYFPIPAWQRNLSMSTNGGSYTARNMPDVALTADRVWATYGGGLAGSFSGTSCAAPLWAGVVALANQQAANYGNPPVGFLNSFLYALASGPNYWSMFHDITTGDNTTASSPNNYPAVAGYDLCTGWGTPNGSNLINRLAILPVVVAQPRNVVVHPGSNAVFRVSVTGAPPFSYQWAFAGSGLMDSTNASLVLTNVQSANVGNYQVAVRNPFGAITSAMASLTLTSALPPTIIGPPLSLVAQLSADVHFSVTVSGTRPFSYQWQFNGVDLPNNLITTIAGNGSAGYSGDSGPATAATLNGPLSIAADPNGNLYIADVNNSCVRKVSTSGEITTLATGIRYPTGVAVDAQGNVYVAQLLNSVVARVDTNGLVTIAAGVGTGGFSGDGGPATQAALSYPNGVGFDGFGELYIADRNNSRIRRVDKSGIISTVAGTSVAGFFGDGGYATNAALSYPLGVCADGSGNLYIADGSNNRIRKVDRHGVITTVTGTNAPSLGDGGLAINAGLNSPVSVAIDALGNMYIADVNDNRIRMVDTDGYISTVAGKSVAGYSGDGGSAANASLNFPAGVALDPFGNLYIADTSNDRIRKVMLSAGHPILTLHQVGITNAGEYSVVVSSPFGSVTSAVATLTLEVPRSPPRIIVGDATFGLKTNHFAFSIAGITGQTIIVDGSTNLMNWSPLYTNIVGNHPISFLDPASPEFPWRFYRARLQ